MQTTIRDVEVHYVEYGEGLAVLALHGSGVDHREVQAWLEPIFATRRGYRRIYPDLPGMGRTKAPDRLTSNDDVVNVLLGFLDRIAIDQPFLVIGHSYGAYLARAIVAKRGEKALGLAMVCPIGESTGEVPAHEAVHSEPDTYDVLPADQAGAFDEYFVLRTPEMARRYLDAVAPGVALADETALGRIFGNWSFDVPPEAGGPYRHPALILTGRQDSTVGYADARTLLPDYPHATCAVLDGAGHALPHEQPGLLAAFVDEWLARIAAR